MAAISDAPELRGARDYGQRVSPLQNTPQKNISKTKIFTYNFAQENFANKCAFCDTSADWQNLLGLAFEGVILNSTSKEPFDREFISVPSCSKFFPGSLTIESVLYLLDELPNVVKNSKKEPNLVMQSWDSLENRKIRFFMCHTSFEFIISRFGLPFFKVF